MILLWRKVQPGETYIYPVIDENVAGKIIEDAHFTMRKWGVKLPDAYVAFDSDPDRHMCNIVE